MHKGLLLLFILGVSNVAGNQLTKKLKRKNAYSLVDGKAKKKMPADEWVYEDDNYQDCGNLGISEAEIDNLKKNKMVSVKSFQWTVYVVKKQGSTYQPICMASLLPDVDDESTSIFLTDSTCIPQRNELENYYIYTGELPVKSNEEELFPVESVVIDKSTPNPTEHNAMVITIQGEVTFETGRKVVCLPKPSEKPKKDAFCVIATLKMKSPTDAEPTLYSSKYTAADECKMKSHEVQGIDSRLHVCGFDQRQGSMLSKGAPVVCLEEGKWVQYGIEAFANHIIEDAQSTGYYESSPRDSEKPSVIVDVGRFRKLMSESKSLMKFGRINLMQMR